MILVCVKKTVSVAKERSPTQLFVLRILVLPLIAMTVCLSEIVFGQGMYVELKWLIVFDFFIALVNAIPNCPPNKSDEIIM